MKMAVAMCVILVGMAGLSAAEPIQPKRFYISTAGNDGWSGRLASPNRDKSDGPFASLAKAQKAVRELKKAGLSSPTEVLVQAGTYYLKEPLKFTPEDSGTDSYPITYRAQGKVTISGGEKITGWRKEADGRWVADVPEARDGKWNFRLLRVGDKWATRARYPNFDPKEPTKGGWLFADFHAEPSERGLFGIAVGNVHNVGDRLIWKIRVPASATYRVWLRYASNMKAFNVDDMGGRTVLQVDEAEPVPLMNLPETGSWSNFKWSKCANLSLTEGEHTLRWTNLKGGGLSLDAFAFTEDDAWDPSTAIGDFTWWGSFSLKQPSEGKHLIIVQAEACDKAEGKEINVPNPTPGGETKFLRFKAGDLPAWSDVSGAVLHIFPAWGWVNAIVPVESIDYTKRRIIFPGSGADQDVRVGNRYFIENVREVLDAPGEWYLDTEQRTLTYLPESRRFPNVEVVAPRVDRLIEIKGDSGYVENLRFDGFAFTDTDYTPIGGYYSPCDATITMSHARKCVVSNCRFQWLGGYALKLENGSEQIEFTGNDLNDLGQGGVVMMGDTKTQAHHNMIAGNIMRNLGLIYKHVAGVYVTTGSNNTIIHNTISDVPRYGISLKSYSAIAVSQHNLVEFNDIRRSNLETNDTGAIETLGCHRENTDNVIRHNLIMDVIGFATGPSGNIITPYFTWGIYLDDYSSGATVVGNIVVRTVNGGICVHGGKDNVFENNIFVDSLNEQIRLQPRDEFMKGNKFVRNIVSYPEPDRALVLSWDKRTDRFSEWDNNVYWCTGGDLSKTDKQITFSGNYTDWLKSGYDAHSVVADPLFVDAANDDYRLKPDSPALKLGFRQIPVDMIGADYWRHERNRLHTQTIQ